MIGRRPITPGIGPVLRLLLDVMVLLVFLATGIWSLTSGGAGWRHMLAAATGAAAFAAAGGLAGWLIGQRTCSYELRRQVLAWEDLIDVVLKWVERLELPVGTVQELEDAIATRLMK